jgi:type I restriction enzyme S subunit
MSEWKEYKLDEIASVLNNKRVPLSSMQRAKRKGKYPYYGASGIVDYIDDFIFDGEYVLISEDGENLRSRNTPIAFAAKGKFWVNNHSHILKGKSDVINKWIIYFFKNIDINPYLTGAVQPKLNKENLLSIPLLLPNSETELSNIVTILSSLDDKIELNNKINQELESLAQLLFKHWFVDFEFPNENGEPYKSSGGEMVESELGEVPKGWICDTIESLTEKISSGGTPSTKRNEYYEGEIKWFSTKELQDGFLFQSERTITELGLNNSSAKIFPNDTVLMAIYAAPTVGRLGILTENSAFNQAAIGLIAKKEVGREFIYLLLKYLRNDFNNLANGAAQQNLNVGLVKNYKVVKPNKEILSKFNLFASTFFSYIKNNQIEINELKKTRDYLLPKLISGELQINDN